MASSQPEGITAQNHRPFRWHLGSPLQLRQSSYWPQCGSPLLGTRPPSVFKRKTGDNGRLARLLAFVCVYILIYIYICRDIYRYTYIYICMYVYACMYTHVCIRMYVYACMYTHVCMYVCICIHNIYIYILSIRRLGYIYICVNVFIYGHVNVYIYIYYVTHVYISISTCKFKIYRYIHIDACRMYPLLLANYLLVLQAFSQFSSLTESICDAQTGRLRPSFVLQSQC